MFDISATNMAARLLVVLVLVATLSLWSVRAQTTFTEKLLITPLHDQRIAAVFYFTLAWPRNGSHHVHHYDIFPRALGDVIQRLQIHELHASLTQGRWHTDRWGYPLLSAPTGAELRSWFLGNERVDERWSELVHAMSGILCSSFNFLDETQTSSPNTPFSPKLVPDNQDLAFRYGQLPAETMCTENVTPWLKFLPCQSMAGLASVLGGKSIYDSRYQSLAIDFHPRIQTDGSISSELALSLTVILPGLKSTQGTVFTQLFGQTIQGACPLASESHVLFHMTNTPGGVNATNTEVSVNQNQSLWSFSILPDQSTDFQITFSGRAQKHQRPALPVSFHRFLSGVGQQGGSFVTQVFNRQNHSLEISILEHYPWFLRVFLHTLSIDASTGAQVERVATRFLPSKARIRPAVLDLTLVLPPLSTTRITIDFLYVFLRINEHRPDANRGFDIGGSVLTFGIEDEDYYLALAELHAPNQIPPSQIHVYTSNLLASLPTPDFSMPYNVITLTSTILALFFGSFFNLFTRKIQPVNKDTPQTPLARLLAIFTRPKAKVD